MTAKTFSRLLNGSFLVALLALAGNAWAWYAGTGELSVSLVLATLIAMAMIALAYGLLVRDERARRRAALAHGRLEAANRLLLESTGEGIYGIDREGHCTFANPACARLLGYDEPNQLLGKPTHDLFHHTRPDGKPYPREDCLIYRAALVGKGVRVDDELFWRRDGTSFPVEYRSYPIHAEGQVVGAVVSFVDNTWRRRAEEAMRLRERALRAIAQGVLITDPTRPEETITFVNAAFEKLTGYSLLDVKGRDVDLLAGADTDPDELGRLRVALHQGLEYTADLVLYRKDGTSFWASLSLGPVRDKFERVTNFVGIVTDITARKLFEEELRNAKDAAEAANVTKSQFLANMSHELRTPLNAVIMYSELLQEEAEDRQLDTFIPDLDKIRNAGRHLLALVNGVLDLSKIEAGKMEVFPETFDVCAMIDEVAGTVAPLVQRRKNRLELHCPSDLGSMHSDLTKVRQVLFNLVSNACKFTEAGVITIEAERLAEDHRLKLVVRDTGIGISREQMDRLFRPFTQADASTTRKYGGTGLGLTISKRFVEMLGGTISVTSQPGKGSAFTVELPAESVRGGSGHEHELATRPRVLVIDDEPAARDFMSRFLGAEGLEVVTAADGEEGLRRAAEQPPALIFLDLLMPRMDGWAVLQALKANPVLAETPVILMTVMNQSEMGFVLGAADYLTKPIDRDRLAGILRKYQVADRPAQVLIVEDDRATRDVLRRTLVREGWTVAEAENGQAALECLGRHLPELILLDLVMPLMDGFAFLERLRQEPAWQKIPVVVVTSRDLNGTDRARLAGNVEKIVEKGATTRENLLGEVRRLVALYTRRKSVKSASQPTSHTTDSTARPEMPAVVGKE